MDTVCKVEAFCTIPPEEREYRRGEETYHEWWKRVGATIRRGATHVRVYSTRGRAQNYINTIKYKPNWDCKVYTMTGEWVECPD